MSFAMPASAQSSVTLYGLLDLSVGSFQAPGGKADNAVSSGNMSTSYIGFKGTEDLGGGLSAGFTLESFLRADTGEAARFNGDVFWARAANVSLSSTSLGSVAVGRVTPALFVQTLIFNAFGDSFGFSPSIRHYYTSGTVSGDSGWSDSVKYASPNIGGLSFTLQAAAGEGNGGHNTGVGALYFAGPLALGAVWQEARKGSAVADTTTWQIAGSYDFSAVKLFCQLGQVDDDTSGKKFDIAGLGLAAPIGAGKLLLQYGQIAPDTGADRTTVSLGYDHSLSKRTDVYAVYMSDKIEGLATGNTFAVGIKHKF
jgi:predicted porin